MKPEAKQWLTFARTDYMVAKHLDETYYPKPLEIICYHCQQSAEKAIKAIIVELCKQESVPKKHDLSFLLECINASVEVPERYMDYADTLTPYGVAVRYPNELYIEEHNALTALRYAEEILQWAENVTDKHCDELD